MLLLAAAVAMEPANTTASAGPLTVTGLSDHALHEHGGESARLASARFRVEVAQPVRLEVAGVTYLRGHTCDAPPTNVASEPKVVGLVVKGAEPARRLELAAGTHELEVAFAPVEAYYTYCDRFAFRVAFAAGEHAVTAVAETLVTRIEPLREDPF
ncbi:MAG: hypothetical protein KC656_12705 [Myxococcales bacterium]|nr:hypothetical protein [Myxococcales bacterium]